MNEKNLVKKIKSLDIKPQVDTRLGEFKKTKNLFSELCFCILTANFRADRCIEIQNQIDFKTERNLTKKLQKLGHRFYNKRAEYIIAARKKDIKRDREYLVKNIKGLGYKEASHFLRNIGEEDYAIVDFHIIDLLVKYNMIKRPKTITKRVYLDIEDVLRKLAKTMNMNLAELDLYLWYLETGKILK